MHRLIPQLGLLKQDEGNALIEFAFCVIILVVSIFGILDFARALYVQHYLANAAREATRYAMVRGSSWAGSTCSTTTAYSCTATSTNVTSFVRSVTPGGIPLDGLNVSTSWPGIAPSGIPCDITKGTNSPGCVVIVQISYSFKFLLPFVPATPQWSSTAAITIMQ